MAALPAAAVAVALIVALSPLLADLAAHLGNEAWTRSWLIFPLLFVVAVRGSRETALPGRDGLLWIAGAALIEILALASGLLRMGRPAIVLAAIGWCRITGRATWPAALLALWWIPPPSLVVKQGSPALESALARLGAAPFDAVVADGPRLGIDAGTLSLDPAQGGLPLVALLAGLGWYVALRTGHGLRGCALGATLAALAGLPLQALATLAACALLAGGAPHAAANLLAPGLALAVLAGGVLVAEDRPRTTRLDREEPRVNREQLAMAGLVAVLLAVGGYAWSLQLRAPLQVDPAPLAALPMQMDVWQAREIPLDQTVESMLEADFNLQRAYRNEQDELVWLYVGYYGTERGGRPEHTPWACYDAQGWNFVETRVLDVDDDLGLRVNEVVVEQDGERRLVHFWYRSHRSTGLVRDRDLILDHTLGRLGGGRADGALVRLSTPLEGPPGEEARARQRLTAFGTALERDLASHWPRETAS